VLTVDALIELIAEAGRTPVERDALYGVIEGASAGHQTPNHEPSANSIAMSDEP
jgi:hypothetical protein